MFVYSHVVLDNYLTGEANVTAMHVEKLISSGVSKDDIAVISPYNLQVSTEFCGYQSVLYHRTIYRYRLNFVVTKVSALFVAYLLACFHSVNCYCQYVF